MTNHYCRLSGRFYSPALMRSKLKKSHNFRRLPISAILYTDFLKFSENRDKIISTRTHAFSVLLNCERYYLLQSFLMSKDWKKSDDRSGLSWPFQVTYGKYFVKLKGFKILPWKLTSTGKSRSEMFWKQVLNPIRANFLFVLHLHFIGLEKKFSSSIFIWKEDKIRASFHLRWKENLAKHERVSKYFENDCRYLLGFLKTPFRYCSTFF